MRAVDIIARKRDGAALSENEIRFFCNGAVGGQIKDYQVSAFLMAVYLRGMDDAETAALTLAMAESGEQLDLSSLPGVTVDKHSTGGVGDTTTLVLAPLAAACGARVAKMSGRGLGHTGGTLDKLESIPGLSTDLTREQFLDQVSRIGLAIVGQTPTLVPADRLLYGLRDVTATINSIPLIASSVMSKKLAAGAQAILLDVKAGGGGFMKTHENARALARTMVDIGRRAGRRIAAVITDMDAPLGDCVGNALDVREAIEILRGEHEKSALREVALILTGHLLALAGLAGSAEIGTRNAEEALTSGRGLEKLREMIEAQGGDGFVVHNLDLLPRAKEIAEVEAPRGGWVTALDALAVGNAAALLGAGRLHKEDSIDPAVGVVLRTRPGARVAAGDVIAELHLDDTSHKDTARRLLLDAIQLADERPVLPPRIVELITV